MEPTRPPAGKGNSTSSAAEATRSFSDRLHGTLIRPGDTSYESMRRVWNGMIDKHPALIVRCRGTADVREAVRFARQNDLSVAVRGGGHHVAGNAVSDGGLVIDLSEMRGVFVDPQRRTVRAQGGATLGDVDRETQVFGLATPLGVVTATGIAGLTLNGGMGHLRRQYGLSCDNLVSAELVTADGDVLTASTDQSEELFWALRGGGGNFGVVTSFAYRLHEVGPDVTVLFAWYRGEEAADVLRGFRERAEELPNEVSVLAFYAFVPPDEAFPEEAHGKAAVALLGCHAGAPADADSLLRPLRELADPIADLSGRMPFTDLQSLLDADYPDGRRYYWKATFLRELHGAALDLIARCGAESPSKLSTIDLWHLGGAIGEISQDATAFWHRDTSYLLTFEANWDDPADDEANITWAREGIAEARSLPGASGSYGNFPGFLEDPVHATYGDHYERLQAAKARYDPTNFFRYNLNIEPAT